MTHDITSTGSIQSVLRAFVATVAFVVAGTTALVATAPSTFRPATQAGSPLAEHRFEVVLGRAAWLVAAVTLAWLVLSMGASVTRRKIPALRGCWWLDRATLPGIRRFIDKALAISVISGASLAAAAPAGATNHTNHANPAAVVSQRTASTQTEATAPVPPYVRGAEPRPTPIPTHPEAVPQPPTSPARPTHVVAHGDNLWSIARNELQARGATPTNQQVAVYWGELLRRNRHLRSGNPSLIFPGEVVHLAP